MLEVICDPVVFPNLELYDGELYDEPIDFYLCLRVKIECLTSRPCRIKIINITRIKRHVKQADF